jgi:hypothetical protein
MLRDQAAPSGKQRQKDQDRSRPARSRSEDATWPPQEALQIGLAQRQIPQIRSMRLSRTFGNWDPVLKAWVFTSCEETIASGVRRVTDDDPFAGPICSSCNAPPKQGSFPIGILTWRGARLWSVS